MIIISLFSWWYWQGWLLRINNIIGYSARLAETFSLGILVKTLFKPWKQMTDIGPKQTGLNGLSKSLVDGFISRLVGFFIRSFVLTAGILYIFLATIFNIALAIIWPTIPLVPILLVLFSMAAA